MHATHLSILGIMVVVVGSLAVLLFRRAIRQNRDGDSDQGGCLAPVVRNEDAIELAATDYTPFGVLREQETRR